MVKKTALDEYSNVRSNGLIAINLEEGDELVGVRITDGNQQIVLSTREGQAIRFKEEEVRSMGRATFGVTGMELESYSVKDGKNVILVKDEIVSIATSREDETLLTVSELGFGKRTRRRRIPPDSSGRQGRHHDERHRQDRQSDQRAPGRHGRPGGPDNRRRQGDPARRKHVRITGRNAQGVRLVKLDPGEHVRAVAGLAEPEDDENGGPSNGANGARLLRTRTWRNSADAEE